MFLVYYKCLFFYLGTAANYKAFEDLEVGIIYTQLVKVSKKAWIIWLFKINKGVYTSDESKPTVYDVMKLKGFNNEIN